MANLQELIDLTPEQEKSWNRLVRLCIADFRAAGGKFIASNTLSAYNGEHVPIDNDKGYHTASVYMPSIDAPGTSWADDWHGITLKYGVKRMRTQHMTTFTDKELIKEIKRAHRPARRPRQY